jgi:predicted  nucleic acid-binding Zn-ribbon protein
VDSGSQLSGGGVGDAERDEERRVEELLRINARLAAEVRSLVLGRTEEPRPGKTTAPRKIGSLTEERDTLTEKLEAAEGELTALREHSEALERDRDALAAEVQRLRDGWRGLARRARARLLGR